MGPAPMQPPAARRAGPTARGRGTRHEEKGWRTRGTNGPPWWGMPATLECNTSRSSRGARLPPQARAKARQGDPPGVQHLAGAPPKPDRKASITRRPKASTGTRCGSAGRTRGTGIIDRPDCGSAPNQMFCRMATDPAAVTPRNTVCRKSKNVVVSPQPPNCSRNAPPPIALASRIYRMLRVKFPVSRLQGIVPGASGGRADRPTEEQRSEVYTLRSRRQTATFPSRPRHILPLATVYSRSATDQTCVA